MSDFQLSRWVFLRLLGFIYLLAFASLTPQIIGLVGVDGLLPATEYLERAKEFYGAQAYTALPTLGWLSASDGALLGLCWGGIALSAVAIVGVAPVPTFWLLWVLYLSLTVLGQTFLSFQWDVLLLETGLLAGLYAPLGWWPRRGNERTAPAAVRWLLWLLLFKLMFLSGITKLVSGDETWWGLTALTYHYQTQPLPVWTSWYVHHLPGWLHMASTVMMFLIELVVPFLVLAPSRLRRTRAAACVLLCLFQVGIAATGNYGFFNLLTVVLCIALLDDQHLRWLLPRGMGRKTNDGPPVGEPRPWRVGVTVVAVPVAVISMVTIWHGATYASPHPAWSNDLVALARPLRSINTYGLFRTMTTERPEIIVEGSMDGTSWEEYSFRWKPGDLDRAPRFVQPHMPRLDWQMWFAALDPYGNQQWLTPMLEGLLENSPSVLGLLEETGNPFPDEAPRYVRLMHYRYDFTTPDERLETGTWWRRELIAPPTGPVTISAP